MDQPVQSGRERIDNEASSVSLYHELDDFPHQGEDLYTQLSNAELMFKSGERINSEPCYSRDP